MLSLILRCTRCLASPLVIGLAIASCTAGSDGATALVFRGPELSAKPGAGPAVTSVDPPYGEQGEVFKRVRILGSGFGANPLVAWERDGVPDPKITVHEAVTVSSTEIQATISIAPDATLDLYDIAVTVAGKKGIGTESFEVTQAEPIGTFGGNALANVANDRGQVVGYSQDASGVVRAFVWPGAGAMVDLGAGNAYDVDDSGTTIVGYVGNQSAATWSWNGTSWASALLPVDAGAVASRALAVASDTSGMALIIAGVVEVAQKRQRLVWPRLWRHVGASWARDTLRVPAPYVDVVGVNTVTASGAVLGNARTASTTQPVYWDASGTPTLLPKEGSMAYGMNRGATIAVGQSDNQAAYWLATEGVGGARTWSGPFFLPGGCSHAIAVDDAGNIAGHGCMWRPPYGEVTSLGGLGDPGSGSHVGGMAPNGLVVGGAGLDGRRIATVWRVLVQ